MMGRFNSLRAFVEGKSTLKAEVPEIRIIK